MPPRRASTTRALALALAALLVLVALAAGPARAEAADAVEAADDAADDAAEAVQAAQEADEPVPAADSEPAQDEDEDQDEKPARPVKTYKPPLAQVSQLMLAAMHGDHRGVQRMLRDGASAEDSVQNGELTAAHFAVLGRARSISEAVLLGSDPMAGSHEKALKLIAGAGDFDPEQGCPVRAAVRSGLDGHASFLLSRMTDEQVAACAGPLDNDRNNTLLHHAARADVSGALELLVAATGGNAAAYRRVWNMTNLVGAPALVERLDAGGRVTQREVATAVDYRALRKLADRLGEDAVNVMAELNSYSETAATVAARVPRPYLLELFIARAREVPPSEKNRHDPFRPFTHPRTAYGMHLPTVAVVGDWEEVVPDEVFFSGYGHRDALNCSLLDVSEQIGLPSSLNLTAKLLREPGCALNELDRFADQVAEFMAGTEERWGEPVTGWATLPDAELEELEARLGGAATLNFAELVDAPELRQILTFLLSAGKPYVLRGAAVEWLGPLAGWRSRDGLMDSAGSAPVRVGGLPMTRVAAVPSRTATLDDFCAAWTGDGPRHTKERARQRRSGALASTGTDEHPPTATVSERVSGDLLKEVGGPQGMAMQARVKEATVGPARAGSAPSFRGGMYYSGLVAGRRRVLAWPPSQAALDFRRVGEWLDTEEGAAEAASAPYQVTLEAGDVVYIPPLWSHAAVNLADTVAVDVEFPPM